MTVMPLHLHHDGLSRPLENPRLRVLSLGAGVQSTTLALMAARGDLGVTPDCAIFADTGDEPLAVYRHLAWLMGPGVLPFPVHVVKCEKPLGIALVEGDDAARIPFHVGAGGLGTRQCTRNWKLRPIRRKTRELLGAAPRGAVSGVAEMWIGISTDEVARIKPSGVGYTYNRHVLIEARMSRQDCIAWLRDRQYRLPRKSRCRYCPYQSNDEWSELAGEPSEWLQAVALDDWLRAPQQVQRFRGEVYLHASRKPLKEVDLTKLSPPSFFDNECEGMCGV